MDADGADLPLAFSGQRLDWRDLPAGVRARIVSRAGAQVTAELSATAGFSPGFVAVLELADGRAIFVKAVSPRENPASPALARAEVRVAEDLPAGVPAPALLWCDDDGEWVITAWEALHGRTPQMPWRRSQLEAVLVSVDALSRLQPRPGHHLPTAQDALADDFTGWQRLATAGRADRLDAALGEVGEWARGRLPELAGWEKAAPDVLVGDHLVHGDLRSDNVMIDDHDKVWFIDWPHAAVGAPWLNLAFLLPSVAAEGGGDPAALFASQPAADQVAADDLRAALAGLAGYFAWECLQPAPRGIPNLRSYQAAQARATLTWLTGLS